MSLPQRLRFFGAVALLAAAAIVCGVITVLLFPVGMAFVPRRPGFLGNLTETIQVVSILMAAPPLGILLAFLANHLLSHDSIRRTLTSALLATVIILFAFCAVLVEDTPIAMWLITGSYCLAEALTLMCLLMSVTWTGRLNQFEKFNPLLFISLIFLGSGAGLSIAVLYWEVLGIQNWSSVEMDVAVRSCIVAVSFLAFVAFHLLAACVGEETPLATGRSSSPGWLRRLQWAVLGGAPAAIVIAMPSYVATELAPFPLFWLLPWTFFFISWIVALARMAPAGITLSARIIQILGALIVLPLVMLVIHVNADLGASVPWMQIGFFAALLIAVFIPHRLTLPLQGSLLAIVLLQMYSQIPIPVDWAILAHTSFCVAACWGCQGDAVKDAPAVDRLPEFLLCVFAGFVGASITFAIVVPLVFAQGPGPIVEYTVALIGGVIVRIIPWPKAHEAQQKSPTASRPSGFENISAN